MQLSPLLLSIIFYVTADIMIIDKII